MQNAFLLILLCMHKATGTARYIWDALWQSFPFLRIHGYGVIFFYIKCGFFWGIYLLGTSACMFVVWSYILTSSDICIPNILICHCVVNTSIYSLVILDATRIGQSNIVLQTLLISQQAQSITIMAVIQCFSVHTGIMRWPIWIDGPIVSPVYPMPIQETGPALLAPTQQRPLPLSN